MDNNIDQISRGLASTTSRRQAFKMLGGGLLGGALAGAGFAVAKDTAAQRPISGIAEVPALGATVTQLTATLTDAGIVIDGLLSTGETIADYLAELDLGNILDLDGATANSTCDVLYLDLLGLVVEITAVPGAGNLLGNLLCAVAGLLDNGGPLAGITGLLNNIFRGLG